MISELRAQLAAIPDVTVPTDPTVAALVADEVQYLASDAALASIARDPYWPKWHSPWWSMTLLWELGEAARIPRTTVDAMVASQAALPLKIFPLRADEWPPHVDHARHASCHCALGTIDQVLTACGIDVDSALPWMRPWYARYQMADGGLNCDERAYSVHDEVPSSIVGTVAPFEAMTARGASLFTERAAAMLTGRELRHGSATRANAEERASAQHWGELTFPRFYFYDVLRGLTALVRWATQHERVLPLVAVAHVVTDLCSRFSDGVIRIGRAAYTQHGSREPDPSAPEGPWIRVPAHTRPLLTAVSQIGAASPALTREWSGTRRQLLALIDSDRLQG